MGETIIYKYRVPIDRETVKLPVNGDIIHVDMQDNEGLIFWTLGARKGVVIEREFRVFPTGKPIPSGYSYIGTALSPFPSEKFSLPAGSFVWHLFEKYIPKPVLD